MLETRGQTRLTTRKGSREATLNKLASHSSFLADEFAKFRLMSVTEKKAYVRVLAKRLKITEKEVTLWFSVYVDKMLKQTDCNTILEANLEEQADEIKTVKTGHVDLIDLNESDNDDDDSQSEKEIIIVKQRKVNALSELAKLQHQVTKREEEYTTAIEELKVKLDEANAFNANIQNNLEKKDLDFKVMEEKIPKMVEECAKYIQERDSTNKCLESDLLKKEKELEQSQGVVNKLQSKNEESKKEIKSYIDFKQILSHRDDLLRSREDMLKSVQQERDELKQRLLDKDVQFKITEGKERRVLKDQIRQLRAEVDQRNQTIAEGEAGIKEREQLLNTKIKEWHAQVDGKKSTDDLFDLQTRIQRLTKSNTEMRHEYDKANLLISKYAADASRRDQNIADKQLKLEELQMLLQQKGEQEGASLVDIKEIEANHGMIVKRHQEILAKKNEEDFQKSIERKNTFDKVEQENAHNKSIIKELTDEVTKVKACLENQQKEGVADKLENDSLIKKLTDDVSRTKACLAEQLAKVADLELKQKKEKQRLILECQERVDSRDLRLRQRALEHGQRLLEVEARAGERVEELERKVAEEQKEIKELRQDHSGDGKRRNGDDSIESKETKRTKLVQRFK